MDLGANIREFTLGALAVLSVFASGSATLHAQPAGAKQPNIVVIMGDDIGMWNIGAYHRGLMAGKTPNLDKMAKEGMLFTDYYAEASCTAGRANFITGELPIRTGMTTVGQAGAKIGIPAEAVTIATILKSMGYATGQFGKNHLGDMNEFLPCVHGFDEFFGYLYHLDAMEDPAHPNYPQNLLNVVGPRNMVHCWATDKNDTTAMPRWGEIGKQRIEDAGPLYPKRMETVDDEILDLPLKFMDKSKTDNKPFFVWLNPTRMHIVTHLSPKYEALRNSENGWSEEEAGMAQIDDDRRLRDAKAEGHGRGRQYDCGVHHRQRHRSLHLARWRSDPVRAVQGNGPRGRVPRACDSSLARSCAGGLGAERNFLRPGLVADVCCRSRQSEHHRRVAEEAKRSVTGPTRTIWMATTRWPLSPAKAHPRVTRSSTSAKARLARCGLTITSSVLSTSPQGWLGEKTHPDVPYITNLRLDPFERTGWPSNGTKDGAQQYFDWFKYEFWRFVFVQQIMGKEIQTFLDYPPMQRGASFNLDAIKAEMSKRMAEAEAAAKGPSN